MNKVIPKKEELIELYVNQKLPIYKVAKKLEMSVGKTFKYINIYNIETRKDTFNFKNYKHTKETKEKISQATKGKKRSIETKIKISKAHKIGGIGSKKKRKDGYISVYFPDHPGSNKDGYIMEHDLVMECYIGRWLNDDEIVHHKNHIRDDNRIENLQLMTFREHARLHMIERHNKNKERRDDLSIR